VTTYKPLLAAVPSFLTSTTLPAATATPSTVSAPLAEAVSTPLLWVLAGKAAVVATCAGGTHEVAITPVDGGKLKVTSR
jgi:hypothetical protein